MGRTKEEALLSLRESVARDFRRASVASEGESERRPEELDVRYLKEGPGRWWCFLSDARRRSNTVR